MKINFKYIFLAAIVGSTTPLLNSCNDYLELQPQSIITPEDYFTTDAQLRAFLMPMYEMFEIVPGSDYAHQDFVSGDYGTDDLIYTTCESHLTEGLAQVPNTSSKNAGWDFENIYTANYFLEKAVANYEAGVISGDQSSIEHCVGEGYFFRAYAYYKQWLRVGDYPIVTSSLSEDYDELIEASQRRPRNEVARFIMADLDKAYEMMSAKSPDGNNNLVSRTVAAMLKAQVAIFEASWLQNFKGTAFVPGGDGWPGADKSYNAGFQYVAGDIDSEINFFLDEAMKASELVADAVPLVENSQITPQSESDLNKYFDMFGADDMSPYGEVLLWKVSDRSLESWAGKSNYMISKSDMGFGLTRGLIMSFLDKNGLPWYADGAMFTNDDDLFTARLGADGDPTDYRGVTSKRDNRITLFLKMPKQENLWLNTSSLVKGCITEPNTPLLNYPGTDMAFTGYLNRKGLNPDAMNCSKNGASNNGLIVFRAAEAYLIYVEAYYMRFHSYKGTKAETYWEAIRTRAGIAAGTIETTINAIDMTKEAMYDWGAYTAGQVISDPTMYAIRKERRSEFINENLRKNDLRRWRSFDQLITTPYHPQGMKLWSGRNYDLFPDELYSTPNLDLLVGRQNLIQGPGTGANISAQNTLGYDADYIFPYRKLSTLNGYDGLIWKMAHYLSPIEIQEIALTATEAGSLDSSPVYQNPYWPYTAGGIAEQ